MNKTIIYALLVVVVGIGGYYLYSSQEMKKNVTVMEKDSTVATSTGATDNGTSTQVDASVDLQLKAKMTQ